jgi:hypothetical protein
MADAIKENVNVNFIEYNWKKIFLRVLPYVCLTILICLLSSGIGGRALWCDEILRVKGQTLSVAQLLSFEHLKTFCTQTPTGYLFMRPFQLAFGMETGGFFLAALCGGCITSTILLTLAYLNKKRPPNVLSSLVVATNPLLLYYGSELAFYIMWAAAFSVAFACIIALDSQVVSRKSRQVFLVCLILSSSAFVSFHFAGMFVWGIVAAGICLMYTFSDGYIKALRTGAVMAVAIVVNLPMYIGAMSAPQHLGTKTTEFSKISSFFPLLWKYLITLGTHLCGGWFFGFILLLIGCIFLFRKKGHERFVVLSSLISIFAVSAFLLYSHLRGYMPIVARYWVYALSPVLLLMGAGLQNICASNRSRILRFLGMFLGAMIIVTNVIVFIVLISSEGRLHPYKNLQSVLSGWSPGLVVVSMNYYDNRFMGDYYPIPNYGQITSPCFWEKGRARRVDGIRKIRKLKPDTVIYLTSAGTALEAIDAGVEVPGDGMVYQWSSLLRTVLALNLYPEQSSRSMLALQFAYDAQDSLAVRAEAEKDVLVVPDLGWKLVRYSNIDGDQTLYALMAGVSDIPIYKNKSRLHIYVPECMSDVKSWTLKLTMLAYHRTMIKLQLGQKTLPGFWINSTKPSETKSVNLKSSKVYDMLPSPSMLLKNGDYCALQARPVTEFLEFSDLHVGWNSLELSFDSGAVWMLLDHELSPTP